MRHLMNPLDFSVEELRIILPNMQKVVRVKNLPPAFTKPAPAQDSVLNLLCWDLAVVY